MEQVKDLIILTDRNNSMQYGIGTYLSQLKRAFQNKEGINLSIIVFNAATCLFQTVKKENITYYHFPDLRYLPTYDSEIYYRNCFGLLRKKLSLVSPIPFFMLNQMVHYPFIDLIRTYYSEARILYVLHCLMWGFPLKGNTTRFRELFNRREKAPTEKTEKEVAYVLHQDLLIFQSVDQVICLSRYALNLLAEVYRIPSERLCCIYNGLEDLFGSLPEKNERRAIQNRLKREYHFSTEDEIVLYVGRLSANKGIHELLKAFKLILPFHPHARLIIAGDGNEVDWGPEPEKAWARVTYTGRLGKSTVYDFYRMADIGVLPSYIEQCSYVAIEMMMAGLPIVATTSTGLSEMVTEGYNGYKVHLKETSTDLEFPVEELARHLSFLLSDRDQREKTGENARRFFEEHYTLEEMRRGYVKMMDHCIR